MPAVFRMKDLLMPEASGQDSLAAVRHDLANLLMTVRGYAELLLIREGLDPSLRRYPEQIVTAIDRASVILEGLRDKQVEANLPSALTQVESSSHSGEARWSSVRFRSEV